MKVQLIEYSNLRKYFGDTLYIYKWNENAFYAIINNNNVFLVRIPQRYNHLIIITRRVKSFKRRFYKHFSPDHVTVIIVKKGRGFIIPSSGNGDVYTPKELVDGKNKGIVIKLYCQWAPILYEQIRMKGEKYFYIDALSQYQSLSQCFLNHFKLPPKGLFGIQPDDGSLKFISDDIFKHFPFPFNITNIDIKSRTITTVRALSFSQYETEEKTKCDDDDFLQNIDDYLSSSLFLTGWDESLSALLKRKKKKCFLSWKIVINASDCKEQLLNFFFKEEKKKDDDDDDAFSFLLFTQNAFPIILQLLHMTIKDSVKLTHIAVYYFYNFMLQRNIPVLLRNEEKGTKKFIKGGLVFNPLVGVYENIGVVDFQSLYPNIITQYGITKGNVSRVSIDQYKSNEMWYKTHFHAIMDDDEKWCYLSLKGKQKTPVQLLFQHLINKRFHEKQFNNNDILAKIIKRMTNSIYGYYYLPQIPSLYDPLSASMITQYGRCYLKEAKQFITEHFPGTICLYGDTDSLFLYHHHYPLQNIIRFYNSKHKLKLSIESEFQKLILIRKKQYIGKYLFLNNYKFAGFPQKGIPPKIYQLMTSILRQILDHNDDDDHPLVLEKMIETFLNEARSSNKPSDFFSIIRNKQSVFKLKTNDYCLESEYDPSIHVIDEKATVLYHLEKVLKPLFVTILKYPSSFLSDILSQHTIILVKKYLTLGYKVLDFSSNQHFLGIKFNQTYFNNRKIQTFWESPSSSSLSLNITFNENGEYATINDTLFQKSPRFYSIQQLEKSLIPIFEYDKYNYLLRHHVQLVWSFRNFSFPLLSLKLFLQFISGIKLNNEQKMVRPLLSIVRNNRGVIVGIINDEDVITIL